MNQNLTITTDHSMDELAPHMTKNRRIAINPLSDPHYYRNGGRPSNVDKWTHIIVKNDNIVSKYPVDLIERIDRSDFSVYRIVTHPAVIAHTDDGLPYYIYCDDFINRYGCEVFAVY